MTTEVDQITREFEQAMKESELSLIRQLLLAGLNVKSIEKTKSELLTKLFPGVRFEKKPT